MALCHFGSQQSASCETACHVVVVAVDVDVVLPFAVTSV